MTKTSKKQNLTRIRAEFFFGRLLLVLWFSGVVSAQINSRFFDQYDISTGVVKSQVVLPGFFFEDTVAQLAVVSVGQNDERSVVLYSFDGKKWTPRREVNIDPHTLLVDVAKIAGKDRLITFAPGYLHWFDPMESTGRLLAKVAFNYNPPPDRAIKFADLTKDLNGDGLDDIILPDFEGFKILLQTVAGSFADVVQLGPPEPHLDDKALLDGYTYREMGISPISIPWYIGRVHQMDVNRDGRTDLVFWNKGHFDVYEQNAAGGFGSGPRRMEMHVSIDSDGEYSLQYGFKLGYSRQKALHSIIDLNNDGLPDLVTMTLEGDGPFKQTTYEIYFGRPDGSFTGTAHASIGSEGILSGMRAVDLDGDGSLDLKFSSFDFNFFGLIGAFVFNSYSYDLEFYRMEAGAYPRKRNAARRVNASPRGRNAHSPAVLMGDVNGDQRIDLLVGNSDALHVYTGVTGPDLFVREPLVIAVPTPFDEEYSIDVPYRPIRLFDFNGDGKDDVLIHYVSHGVTILIAR